MPYNRENLLRRIIEIQDIVLSYRNKDVPQTVIYRKYIAEQYHISYSCFNNYMAIPAKAQLNRLLQQREQERIVQLTLFDLD